MSIPLHPKGWSFLDTVIMKINLLKLPDVKKSMNVKDFIDSTIKDNDEISLFLERVINKHILLLENNHCYVVGKVVSVEKSSKTPTFTINGFIINEKSFSLAHSFTIKIDKLPKYYIISDESYKKNYYDKLFSIHEITSSAMDYYDSLNNKDSSTIKIKNLKKPNEDFFEIDSNEMGKLYPNKTINDVIEILKGDFNRQLTLYNNGVKERKELIGKVLFYKSFNYFDILLPLSIDDDTNAISGIAVYILKNCIGTAECNVVTKEDRLDSKYAYLPLTIVNDADLNDKLASLIIMLRKSYNKILSTADILLKNKKNYVE